MRTDVAKCFQESQKTVEIGSGQIEMSADILLVGEFHRSIEVLNCSEREDTVCHP